ncbi:MAG TPA: ATP-binding protein, partial [Pyrinomonadaceae bacterium]|nr:ATP-binding protein [Pyrinomonadaceae bacterium]
HLPVTSYLSVPVISRSGEVLGGLFFGHPEAGVFKERDERLAVGLAAQAAIAMDNARLFEAAQRARAQAEAAERRATLLAEASAMLASSLDYEATLANVARLVVQHTADWCAVHIVEEDGSINLLAAAHADPSKVELAQELQRRYPLDPDETRCVANVLRTGQSELYAELSGSALAEVSHSAERLQILLDLGIKSAMVVPMSIQGRTLGAISFASAEAGRRYGHEDLALAEDLAHRAALAVDHARLYREAQRANRIKDDFLATLSHELRTPMTAVLGWTQLLISGQLDEATTLRAIETIHRNARAQSQIIEDILDVSRIITGKLRLNVRPVKLASVIEAAIDSVRPAAEAKSIQLKSVLGPEMDLISGDPDRLQQVIWNLLSNAVKFTPGGGLVEVQLSRVDACAQVRVKDTGVGIKQEFLPYVFDRFRQADSSTTRLHGGLGLGLAIVRHLVELHGGTVQAESEGVGRGVTFTINLPLSVHKEGTNTAGEAKTASPVAESDHVVDASPNLEGVRVLLVDDEPDQLDFLATALKQYGAEVHAVASAAEALSLFEQARPDVLVSDIGMPGEDGYWLIRKVRALESGRENRIPAVALTAYARAEDRMRALLAGFQLHVPKPVEPVELAAVVANLAGRAGQV